MASPDAPRPRALPLADLVARAVQRRRAFLASPPADAFRVFSGPVDGRIAGSGSGGGGGGFDGVHIDVYGPGAVLIVEEGRAPRAFDALFAPQVGADGLPPTPPLPAPVREQAAAALEALRPLGVRAVYVKPFARDRSRLGGALPACATDPAPAAGEALPEAVTIREHAWSLEARLYDGLSTGLFLDQRENRAWVHRGCVARRARGPAPRVLNTFAYTCAFSVAAAVGGAETTSVDVSARYLEWGKRNMALNGVDPALHRFARMDTREFLEYARRKNLAYDLIILDPPSFGSGSKRKGVRAWSSQSDYAPLVTQSAGVLSARGVLFASTNTRELCRPGRLAHEVEKGLARAGRTARWLEIPGAPADFAGEEGRFACVACGC